MGVGLIWVGLLLLELLHGCGFGGCRVGFNIYSNIIGFVNMLNNNYHNISCATFIFDDKLL